MFIFKEFPIFFIPRPARSSPEEDEGFIDEVAEPKKSVQFNSNPEILVEIPSSTSQDDNIKTVDEAKAEKSEEIPIHDEIGAKRHKTVLPPLNGSPKKPQKKSSKNKQRHRTEADATAQWAIITCGKKPRLKFQRDSHLII